MRYLRNILNKLELIVLHRTVTLGFMDAKEMKNNIRIALFFYF